MCGYLQKQRTRPGILSLPIGSGLLSTCTHVENTAYFPHHVLMNPKPFFVSRVCCAPSAEEWRDHAFSD